MSDAFHKILFVGAMIAVIAFANRGGTVAENPIRVTYGDAGMSQQSVRPSPPIFILENPAKVLGNLENVISESEAITIQKEIRAVSPPPPLPNTSLEAPLVSSLPPSRVAQSEGSQKTAFSQPGVKPPPAILARIALVADLESGTSYVEVGKGRQWPLASITKLMTAVVAVQYGGLTERTAVSERAFAVDPKEQNIKRGGTYRISDLFELMFLPSSNVAAETVAEFYGRDAFLAVMNAQAVEWGMRNTHFSDPSGLSVSNQSTAEDLFLLAQRIARDYPEVFRIGREPMATIAEWNENYEFTVKSINKFAGRADFVGGKTGYTDDADGNLLSVFSYGERKVVIIVMGTGDRFGDTEKLLEWFKNNYTHY